MRGLDTIIKACKLHVSRGSGTYNNWACRFADSTVERVAKRVAMGERIPDAWRNELQQIRDKRPKENPA